MLTKSSTLEKLIVRSVSKSYQTDSGPVKALNDVEVEIAGGELFFLLGASGCGKTTLLRCIAGLEQPDQGQILFGDQDVTRLSPHLREAALVFQNYALWPHLTVAENVGFGLEERKIPREEIRRRVDEALAAVHLSGIGGRDIGKMSGGQQQRVALARALVVKPRCLLLDEPLSNLDARLRIDMRKEIRRIVKENGLTAVYVTHDQEEALSMADRLAILDNGRIAQIGRPEEIYRRPASAHVATFIGETNLIPGIVLSREDGDIEVGTEGGVLIGRASQQSWKPTVGAKVVLSSRPECWTPSAEETPNTLAAIVQDQSYLGQRVQLTVNSRLGSLQVVLLNPDRPLSEGAVLRITAKPQEVVVMPAT